MAHSLSKQIRNLLEAGDMRTEDRCHWTKFGDKALVLRFVHACMLHAAALRQ